MARATKNPAPLRAGKTGLTLALGSGMVGKVDVVAEGGGRVELVDGLVVVEPTVVRTGAG